MDERKRCCCNCRHNIRSGEIEHIECHCEIDGHYISYLSVSGWCRRWAKDHKFDEEET